jgi:hypothetical protein
MKMPNFIPGTSDACAALPATLECVYAKPLTLSTKSEPRSRHFVSVNNVAVLLSFLLSRAAPPIWGSHYWGRFAAVESTMLSLVKASLRGLLRSPECDCSGFARVLIETLCAIEGDMVILY